jgi:hypothetical protein
MEYMVASDISTTDLEDRICIENHLPIEIFRIIFQFIEDVPSFASASIVNKFWRQEIEIIWRKYAEDRYILCVNYFITYGRSLLEHEEFWKEHGRSWKWITRMKQVRISILNKTVVQQNPCIFKKIEHYNVLSF